MKKYLFMKNKIMRTCTEELEPYSKYRKHLEKDFSCRCGYCNMSNQLVTASFHIDHFIPKKAFEGKKDYLLTKYDNLIWACPKCNLSKGDAYEGDIASDPTITNKLFYNPVETSYNDIFYRDYTGQIMSDDEKGKQMIKRLKLYRPVHSMAWILDEYEKLVFELEKKASLEKNPKKKEYLEKIQGKIATQCVAFEQKFRLIYMGKEISYLQNNE